MNIINSRYSLHIRRCVRLRQIVAHHIHRNQSFLWIILADWNHMVLHFYLFRRTQGILIPNKNRGSMSGWIQWLTILFLLASHIQRRKNIHGAIRVYFVSLFRRWLFKSLWCCSLKILFWGSSVSVLAFLCLCSFFTKYL